MIRPCTVYLAVVALMVTTGYHHHVVSSAPTTPPRENINAVIIPSSSYSSSSSSPPSQLPSSSIVNSNISTSTAAAMEDVGDDNNLSNSSIPNPSLLRSSSSGGGGSSSSSEHKSISEYPLSQKEQQQQQQQQQSKSSSRSSGVAFLYELYEHEIYNPQTASWTSRRFTQSPNTGGGGRDSTSLDPGTCVPPRNYIFDGEWKIDMSSVVVVSSSSSSGSGEERDGFGWEYYVGRYDGLGRRRRRWVRSLLRVVQHGGKDDVGVTTRTRQNNAAAAAAAATRLSSSSSKKKQTKIKQKQKQQQVKNNNLLRTIQEQYNFKGFGWSINKSVIFLHSIGATLRIPLSANFDSYEQYRAAPFISTGIYFGYPWAIATMLNASLPIEAIQWSIAGILYKIHWGMAVTSASIRLCIDVVIYVILWPWRLWSKLLKAMTKVIESSRVLTTRQQQKQHVDPSKAAELIVNDTDGRTIVSIETHIELNNNNSSLDNEVGEDDNSETVVSVVDSPRGGGGGGGGGGESGRRRDAFDVVTSEKMVPFFRKEHRTILGHEVPPYHRSTTIEYSSTIQERLGVSMSWRLSRNRGYEYRCNFFFSCMPTRTFWKQLEEERKRRLESFVVRRKNEKVSAMTPLDVTTTDDKIGTINIDSSRYIQNIRSILPSFLTEHYSAVGISTGWPLPMEPYYALSLVLSMSGFYYGWLMDYVRSIVLPSCSSRGSCDEKDKKLGSTTDNISSSGKIVSSMLKKKNLPLDDEDDDNMIEIAENDDDSTSIGSKKAKAK